MSFLTKRILTPEIMDGPDVPAQKLRKSFGFIRKINRWFGGSGAVIGHLKRWSRRWKKGETTRILDIATGCADIPMAIARWAARAGHDVRIVAVDLHEKALEIAAESVSRDQSPRTPVRGSDPPQRTVSLLRASALALPFLPKTFDYCITSMFLHHLPDIEVLTVLRMMDRLSTRGLIWNDLTRSRLGYWNTKLITLFSDSIVKHDGPVSVLAGFTRNEVHDFRARLSLDYTRYRKHLWHRFTLAGEM